jgi:hypothetical protein
MAFSPSHRILKNRAPELTAEEHQLATENKADGVVSAAEVDVRAASALPSLV